MTIKHDHGRLSRLIDVYKQTVSDRAEPAVFAEEAHEIAVSYAEDYAEERERAAARRVIEGLAAWESSSGSLGMLVDPKRAANIPRLLGAIGCSDLAEPIDRT